MRRLLCLTCVLLAFSSPTRGDGVSAKVTSRPRLFVLAVGINAYPGKNRLTYAVSDAKDIAAAFRNKTGTAFRDVETKVLTNRQGDRAGILRGLAWLQEQAGEDDMSIVFYSGHGGNEAPIGFFLVPHGFNDREPLQTMVTGRDLKSASAKIKGKVLVLLDCCHAGAILNQRKNAAGRPLLDMNPGGDLGPNVSIVCASRARELASEGPRMKHGFLTKSLLEGLAGKADTNNDGKVTLEELRGYAQERVARISRDRQHAVAVEKRSMQGVVLAAP